MLVVVAVVLVVVVVVSTWNDRHFEHPETVKAYYFLHLLLLSCACQIETKFFIIRPRLATYIERSKFQK